MQQNASNPAIFVFEGGKFTAGKTNFLLQGRGQRREIHSSTGRSTSIIPVHSTTERRPALEAGDSGGHQPGEALQRREDRERPIWSSTPTPSCHNCENGVGCRRRDLLRDQLLGRPTRKVWPRMERLEARGGGTLYVNCHTAAEDVAAEGARSSTSHSGSGLDAEDGLFQQQYGAVRRCRLDLRRWTSTMPSKIGRQRAHREPGCRPTSSMAVVVIRRERRELALLRAPKFDGSDGGRVRQCGRCEIRHRRSVASPAAP